MNSDYNMDFIMRLMSLKYSLDYDMDVFKNCILKFYIFISSEDELAESMLISDALRIIEEAQDFGAQLLDEYDEYEEEENDEEYEDEYSKEEKLFDEFDFEEDEDSEKDDLSESRDNKNVIYLDQEEFDSLTEGLFEEFWEENEKSVYFLLQFEKEEDMDRFIGKEFNG